MQIIGLTANVFKDNDVIDFRLEACVKLLDILQQAKAPLYLYKSISIWLKDCMSKDTSFFEQDLYSREKVFKTIGKKYNTNLQPHKIRINCPSSKDDIDLVIHSFKNSLLSLLADTDLMQEKNLLINKEKPYQFVESKNGCFADINTGSLWKEGWDSCNSAKKEVLCPLIFFIDKTHTDVQGKLSLEPVCFTLGIFNRKTRNQGHAWRTIGYMPNFNLLPKYKQNAKMKLQDYHFVLAKIFEEVYELQTGDGVAHTLFGIDCILKIPIFSFIGDTEGHDKLVGRLGSRNKAPTICRYCICPYIDTDNQNVNAAFIKQNDIQKGGSILQKLGYYDIKNACHKLLYCDNERGIHGATPGELVHVLQLGIIPYILNTIFGAKASNFSERRAKNNSINDSEVYDQSDDNQKTRRNVFSDDVALVFEERVKIIGKLLQHQSDRNLPTTYFSQGILPSKYKQKKDSKKMAAHEYSGVIINTLFMLCSTGFTVKHLDKKLTFIRQGNWISVLEKILLFENIWKCEILTMDQVLLLKNYIPLLMDMIKRFCKRKSSVQWKLIKFHLLTHFTDDIQRNGVPENISTGPCESHHKIIAKNPAKNTQRISNVFHEQVGRQYANNLLLNIHGRTQKIKQKEYVYHDIPKFSGQTFFFRYSNKDDYYFSDKAGVQKKFFADTILENACMDYLAEIACAHNLAFIPCYTFCKFKSWKIRANPLYRSSHWQDWIYFQNQGRRVNSSPPSIVC